MQIQANDAFWQLIHDSKLTVALTTLRNHAVIFLSCQQKPTVLVKNIIQPTGISFSDERLAIAHKNGIALFSNQGSNEKYSSLFSIEQEWHQQALHIHDIALLKNNIFFTNTLHSSIDQLTTDQQHRSIWAPPFISHSTATDQCHLNGVATNKTDLLYATARAECDHIETWRNQQHGSGIIVDIKHNHIVQRGLSLPHSPRYHQDKLYFLNSGEGSLNICSPAEGTHDVIQTLPGFSRGLCLYKDYAFAGHGLFRKEENHQHLPILDKPMYCGMQIINIKTGSIVGSLSFGESIKEIFDISVIPTQRAGLNMPDSLKP